MESAKFKHIHRFTVFFLLLATLISCENEDDLDRQILTTTIWYETKINATDDKVTQLYNFDSGGILRTYYLEEEDVLADGLYRYIHYPDDDKLFIESLGSMKIEDISIDRLRLKNSDTKSELNLKRYGKKITLP